MCSFIYTITAQPQEPMLFFKECNLEDTERCLEIGPCESNLESYPFGFCLEPWTIDGRGARLVDCYTDSAATSVM